MASTYVNDLRLNEMATGDASGSWGTVTNTKYACYYTRAQFHVSA